MRIGIVCLSHESNTFLPTLTRRPDFDVASGLALRERWQGTEHELGGYLAGLQDAEVEVVPLFSATATPSGTIAADTFALLVSDLLEEVERNGPYDGILAAAHGAAVAQDHADADGHWLGQLREHVGARVPLVATVDAHANVTPAMLTATDALIAYRTNPHLDTRARGIEAASLICRIARGEVAPVQQGAFPPMAINILMQSTADDPCRSLYRSAETLRRQPGILSVSIALGFPYADVPEVGTSFVVVADGDRSLAAEAAQGLAAELLARRSDFVPQLIDPATAVEMAALAPGPVCLLDMGDNVGGGSAADGTTLAHIVAERGGPRTFIALYDPEAAAQADALGVGGEASFELGGKTDALHGAPLSVKATVASLHNGRFVESDVRHGGNDRYDMGRTAILETDRGLTVQVTSLRVPPFSLGQITSCGLDPADYQILIAKGVHAPVPAYAPVCPSVIRANTPGSTAADMAALPFERRRVPLFPLEEIGAAHEA